MSKEIVLATASQKPLAISTRPEPPSASWLVKSLAALATARQASVSKDTFLLYASELAELREDDISRAVRTMAFRTRGEGETAFPDLATMISAIESAAVCRRHEEEKQRRNAERDAVLAERAAMGKQ